MFGKNKQTKGDIGFHGLTDWWLNELTQAERKRLREIYQPMFFGAEPQDATKSRLDETNISESSATRLQFIWGLLSWLKKPEDFDIAQKVIELGERYIEEGNVLDQHFFLDTKIEIYYRQRERSDKYLQLAIDACNEQISIAPKAAKAFKEKYPSQPLPRHRGFDQLRIIRKKQKDHEAVIQICEQAKQQSWASGTGWDKEIERAKKALQNG